MDCLRNGGQVSFTGRMQLKSLPKKSSSLVGGAIVCFVVFAKCARHF